MKIITTNYNYEPRNTFQSDQQCLRVITLLIQGEDNAMITITFFMVYRLQTILALNVKYLVRNAI